MRLGTYPKAPQPVILSLPKDGWRLREAVPFDKLRMLIWGFGQVLWLPVLLAFLVVAAGCAPAAMTASSPLSPVATPAPQPFQLTLVHSNDTWGYLLPCG
jgi:hypothetical protein